MKIQINGFDIEINTEEANMSVKVLDANGKELSNNTYTQSPAGDDEINNVDMPSAQNTDETNPPAQDLDSTEAQTGTEGEENLSPVGVANDVQQATEEEQTGESYIPDFETFKKLRKAKKI